MRKSLPYILLFTITTLWLNISTANATAPQPRSSRIKADARYVLQRTAVVLRRTQSACKPQTVRRREDSHHLQIADTELVFALNRAVALQGKAKDLYLRDMHQQSIDFSLNARLIALQAMEWAKPNPSAHHQETSFQNQIDEREAVYWEHRQADLELDQYINGNETTDGASVNPFIKYDF